MRCLPITETWSHSKQWGTPTHARRQAERQSCATHAPPAMSATNTHNGPRAGGTGERELALRADDSGNQIKWAALFWFAPPGRRDVCASRRARAQLSGQRALLIGCWRRSFCLRQGELSARWLLAGRKAKATKIRRPNLAALAALCRRSLEQVFRLLVGLIEGRQRPAVSVSASASAVLQCRAEKK